MASVNRPPPICHPSAPAVALATRLLLASPFSVPATASANHQTIHWHSGRSNCRSLTYIRQLRWTRPTRRTSEQHASQPWMTPPGAILLASTVRANLLDEIFRIRNRLWTNGRNSEDSTDRSGPYGDHAGRHPQ